MFRSLVLATLLGATSSAVAAADPITTTEVSEPIVLVTFGDLTGGALTPLIELPGGITLPNFDLLIGCLGIASVSALRAYNPRTRRCAGVNDFIGLSGVPLSLSLTSLAGSLDELQTQVSSAGSLVLVPPGEDGSTGLAAILFADGFEPLSL